MIGKISAALAFLCMTAICLPAFAAETTPTATYTNPVITSEGAADPSVLIYKETYYLYSTNRDNAVYESKDLVHWIKGPTILPDPYFHGVWAPYVYYHPEDKKFYLYYTVKYKIGVAVADSPEGPFTNLGIIAVPGIDARLFRDDDGRLYLYFSHTPPFSIYCIPMKSPTEPCGPVTKCCEISQDWEKHSFPINEGPSMVKHDGKYTLLYAGSDGQSIYYAIGAAFAPTPIGPFTKYDKNPIFQDLTKVNGSGHGSVTRDRAGQLWLLYPQKIEASKGWERQICLDRVAYDKDGILRGTPTKGEELPVPICSSDIVWSPDISPRGDIFNDKVTVSLSSRTENAQIRYTTDGSEPSATSTLYDKPFELTATATVKAVAFKAGMKTSAIATMQFTKTTDKLPDNPSPNGASADFPFDLFPKPEINWKPLSTKPINAKKPN